MSLINKMLQDLDARGAQDGEPASEAVRPVPHEGRKARVLIVVLGAAVVAGAVGAMLIGFRLMGVTPAPPAPAVLATAAPAAARAPVARLAPAPVAAPAAAAPADPAPGNAPPVPASPETPASPQTPVKAETPVAAATPHPAQPSASTPALAALRAEAGEQGAKDAGHREPAPVRQPRAAMTVDAPALKATATATREPAAQARAEMNAQPTTQLTTQQRAENQYRRALDALQEGRSTEALDRLQQALEIEPRHQAARETLVRLLLESNREEDAMRQLQQALERDAAQPAMAMMLARLQLEKTGPAGPAIDTLTRSLPSAAGNADYLAFLAAVLQRGQRYADSSGYYRQALRLAPQNGVWWMGLGISLQADGKAAEAGEAYARARAAGNLTPELQAFVDGKLQQLGR